MTVALQAIEQTLREIESAYASIPFGNSDYQNRAFVMAAELTPARAYRHIGLRMFDRIEAIKQLKYARELEDIDIEEKQAEIDNPDTSPFDVRRRKIEIQRLLDKRNREDKLLSDAIAELNCLYSEFQKFPKYTREQFEAEECEHFKAKLKSGNNTLLSMQHLESFNALLQSAHETLRLA